MNWRQIFYMEKFYQKKSTYKSKTLLGQVLMFIKGALVSLIRNKNVLCMNLSKLVN